jgi:predicted DCC family thiol-disulfide oxidoreductase YuxK
MPSRDSGVETRSQPARQPHDPRAAGCDIVLYDGVCGLCHRLVQFLLARDRHDRFRFAALQSDFAVRTLGEHAIRSLDLDTVYVIARGGERVLSKSRAVLYSLRRLGGFWAVVASVLSVVPRRVADIGYGLVARTRYRIFGRYDVCRVPAAAERAKFLDVPPRA